MNYDRGGNIMRDFVGVGFSIDLPVFNTNKAAAKVAQFAIEEQNMKFQAATSETEQQARRLKIQLVQYEKLLRRSEERRVGKECRSGWSLQHSKKNEGMEIVTG